MSIRTFKFRQCRSRSNRLNAQVLRSCEFVLGFVSLANSSNAETEGGHAVPSRAPIRCFGRELFIGDVRSERLRSHCQRYAESKEIY